MLTVLMLTASALAQALNPYNGTWTVSFENKKGASLRGTLVVEGAGGTWQAHSPALRRARGLAACEGLQAPIQVKAVTPRKLVITINRSQTRRGCKDSKMAFEKVNERTLKGAYPEGRALSLARE